MERKKEVVLDASVLLKWFLKEDYSELALKLKDDFENNLLEIVLPDLAIYEIINVLRFKTGFSQVLLKQILSILSDLQFREIIPEKEWMLPAIDYAYAFGLTIYDASYLAIARQRSIPFITCDEKMLVKIVPRVSEFSIMEYCSLVKYDR